MAIFWHRPIQGELSRDSRSRRQPISTLSRWAYGIAGLAMAMAMLPVCVALFSDTTDEFLATTIFYTSLGIPIAIYALYRATWCPFEWRLTPEGQLEQQAEERRKQIKQQEADEAFWGFVFKGPVLLRYACATGLVGLVYWIASTTTNWKTGHTIAITAALISAAILARGLALALLAIGGVLLVFSWLSDAKLSTPGAIILGSAIIAYAILVRRK